MKKKHKNIKRCQRQGKHATNTKGLRTGKERNAKEYLYWGGGMVLPQTKNKATSLCRKITVGN